MRLCATVLLTAGALGTASTPAVAGAFGAANGPIVFVSYRHLG